MAVVQFRTFKRRTADAFVDDGAPPVLVAASRANLADPRERKVVETVLSYSRPKSAKAWAHYDNIGELHYAVNVSARICGHASLVPKRRLKNGDVGGRLSDRNVNAVVNSIWSPTGGLRHLVESFVRIRKLNAHAHLIRNRNPDGSPNGYDWISDDEISLDGDRILRNTLPVSDSVSRDERRALSIIISPDDYLGRIWLPHPRYSGLPDSPMGPIDNVCQTLDLLTQTVLARLYSRLAMAGILYVPSEVSEVVATSDTSSRDGAKPFSKDAVLNSLTAGFMTNMKRHDVAASAMPVMLRGPAQYAEALRLIQTDREIWETDMRLREEAQNRMLLGLDITPSAVKGEQDSNHWPVAEWTEVYTRRGWLHWHEVEAGTDEAWTVDHSTGLGSWLPIVDVPHRYVENFRMVEIDRRLVKATATPDHRWPVVAADGERVWRTSDTLEPSDHVICGAPAAQLPTVPTFTDDLVALVAWYSADGTCTKSTTGRPNQIRIAKSWKQNPGKVALLRSCLEGVFGPANDRMERGGEPAFRVEHQERGMEVFILNAAARDLLLSVVPGFEKVVSLSFIDKLTRAQLEVFLQAWKDSDGVDGVSIVVPQADPERLRAVEYAAILSGRSVSTRVLEASERTTAFGDTDLHILRASDAPRATHPQVGETNDVNYTGEIFCLRTPPNASWLARDKGRCFFTGNSSWSNRDQELRVNVVPELEIFAFAMEVLAVVPELEARGVARNKIDGFALGFDLSGATARPNLAEDARQAFDRGNLSPEGQRVLSGIPAEYTPTEEEFVRWLGTKIGDPYLATFGLPVAERIDFDRVVAKSAPGPDPANPGEEPSAGPGVGDPGSPESDDSDTPKAQKPAA